MRRVVAILALLTLALQACADSEPGGERATRSAPGTPEVSEVPSTTEAAAKFTITSAAFARGEAIPAEFSCHGRNVPPPLGWSGVPDGSQALALVVDDPDAVSGLFVHWVVTDIPPDATGVEGGKAPAGATVSANSAGKPEYLGPCPPVGTGVHHYRFRLYALPKPLGLAAGTPQGKATATISGAAIGEARLVGTFSG